MGSEKGAKASAIIYSLIQTCRANKINPHLYLKKVFEHLESPQERHPKELTPFALKKEIQTLLSESTF
jgi:hypothetical protein